MQSIRQEFTRHASLAFFASAWADQCEESENAGILSGQEIMDIMPTDTDPAAICAGESLLADMERINRCSIDVLMDIVEDLGDGDRDNTIENFGHYCAMQAMGHGVGLRDAFGVKVHDRIKVQHVEFSGYSLAVDYFKALSKTR